MIVPILLGLLLGASAFPDDDMRAWRDDFEFMGYSTNLDQPQYRLTDAVQPRNQYVHLDVYLQEARFNGLTEIDVEIIESGLEQIVLHQKVVSIGTVSVLDAAGRPVNLRFPGPFTVDDHYELLIINLAGPIAVGNYTITITYLGRIHLDQFERGFYRGHYFLNNQMRYYATTQFQPFYARTAIPCFDEPQFKNTFVISITRDSSLTPSYSNMPIQETISPVPGRIRETFFPTPVVSSYLVAFTVSDFVETTYTSTATRPFGIVSRPGVLDQHEYAANIGLEITNVMDDYFGIDYYDMGQGRPMKNDHIAIPDFPAGAMENWGMVNYREAYLLYDPAHTNIDNKIFISTIISHEMAHKWFGNLVTCFWWSNLWLNESFASFFEYFSTHAADPSLELDEAFVVGPVHSALNWDAGAGATPMNLSSVANNPSITGHFSTTSYAKGASVLKMMEHLMGERPFRQSTRYYLRENAYGLGTPEDFYNALRRAASEDMAFIRRFPNLDVGEVLDSWVQNGGAPVINVDVNMDSGAITIRQERFLLSGATPAPQRWIVPITWTHSGAFNFDDTTPSLILTGEQAVIQNTPGHNFVILNVRQSGLYRVNYDEHNWEMIASYLRSDNRNNIHKLNRAQIANDVLHFIRSGSINTTLGFNILSFLELETDYYPWAGAIGQLGFIRSRLEHLPLAHAEFSKYLLDIMTNVIADLGYNEASTDSTSRMLHRMQIMNLACNLEHEGCVSDSLEKWNSFRNNASNLVPVNLRRYVYCVGLREGNASDYQFLFNQYESSENTADMVVMLRALGCTRDTASLNHYLAESLVNDKIRVHDRANVISFALQGNPENIGPVLDFLYNNFEEIRETYGGIARLQVVINNVAGFLTNFTDIEAFQTWAYANQVALGPAFSNAQNVITTATNNLVWGNENAPEIYNYLLARPPVTSSAGTVMAPIVIIIAALFSHLFH